MNEKEDIYEMKMINDLYQMFVNLVARHIRSPIMLTGRRDPSEFQSFTKASLEELVRDL